MNTFLPDLVVEVTKACNKACNGCYAPNLVVSNKLDSKAIYESYPGVFLGLAELNNALIQLAQFPGVTSVRGGEPSLHPSLSTILTMLAQNSEVVYLETHGRWLLANENERHEDLIQSIARNKTIIKISFDSMHGMKETELKEVTDYLDSKSIDFRVAITEYTIEALLSIRSKCDWIASDKIMFQFKASSESELVKPSIGTINIDGNLKQTLTNKFSSEYVSLLYLAQ